MQYMNSFKEGAAKALGSTLAKWALGILMVLVYSYGLNEIRKFETNIVDVAVEKALSEAIAEIESAKNEIASSVGLLVDRANKIEGDLAVYQQQINIKFAAEQQARINDMKEARKSLDNIYSVIIERIHTHD